MPSRDQKNGNTQLNSTRDDFNEKVERLSHLGQSKGIQWRGKRRYRNI